MYEEIKNYVIEDVKKALDTDDKITRDEMLKPVYAKAHEKFDEKYEDEISLIDECMYKIQKYVVRRWLIDEQKELTVERWTN